VQEALGSSPLKPVASAAAKLPDLEAIAAQKEAYLRSLQDQVKQGEEMLNEQQKQQTEYIYKAAEAQKQQLINHIDHMARQQDIQLGQKYAQQQMALQQEYQQQKVLLETQATELAREYQRRRVQDEQVQQEFNVHKLHYADQARMFAQIQEEAKAALPQPAAGGGFAAGPLPSSSGSQPLAFRPPVLNMSAFEVPRASFGTRGCIPLQSLPSQGSTVPQAMPTASTMGAVGARGGCFGPLPTGPCMQVPPIGLASGGQPPGGPGRAWLHEQS